MNYPTKADTAVNYALWERTFILKMSPLLKACECSKNLMVGIYLVERNRFFYCNEKLKEVLGDQCTSLLLEGWDFLYSLVDPKEVVLVKNQISNFFTLPYLQNILTLRYHITACYDKNIFLQHEIILHQLEKHFLAINYFLDVTENEKIENCIGAISECIDSRSSMNTILTISPREKQVLRLIADGFSSKEIADMLFISNHTAVSHRKNLIEKFKVKNTAHLIKKASVIVGL